MKPTKKHLYDTYSHDAMRGIFQELVEQLAHSPAPLTDAEANELEIAGAKYPARWILQYHRHNGDILPRETYGEVRDILGLEDGVRLSQTYAACARRLRSEQIRQRKAAAGAA